MPETSAPVQNPLLKASKDVLAGTCGASAWSTYESEQVVPDRGLNIKCLLAGGIVVTFVGHPFDTVKVRLQTQDSAKPIYCEC